MIADNHPSTSTENEIRLPNGGYLRYTREGVEYKVIIPEKRIFGIPVRRQSTHKGKYEKAFVEEGCITLVTEKDWFYHFETEIRFDEKRILSVKGDRL
ncbi:hypothetical protein MK805_15790 [Shimazuella sp. AN120528]|uniref:hypothetical protein n=1 Tax=Shimazuella soli TaxID=1892854 RepID=UPI001F0F7829|nr:hypothetical protein [Shimazuella soli]MCH5586403.1 hypothetical protein [Shimazuella soli]